MSEIEELKSQFEQKENEYNQFASAFEQLRSIMEEESLDPAKIVVYLENLVEDNSKLLVENKELNERLEELVAH